VQAPVLTEHPAGCLALAFRRLFPLVADLAHLVGLGGAELDDLRKRQVEPPIRRPRIAESEDYAGMELGTPKPGTVGVYNPAVGLGANGPRRSARSGVARLLVGDLLRVVQVGADFDRFDLVEG
jgi:hypothetical protein